MKVLDQKLHFWDSKAPNTVPHSFGPEKKRRQTLTRKSKRPKMCKIESCTIMKAQSDAVRQSENVLGTLYPPKLC